MRQRIALATVALTAAAAVAAPAAASAKIVELGQTASPLAAPSCPPGTSPSQCYIILTRTTAVQTVSDGVLNPTKVKSPGWIVAFTVGLSKLSTSAKTESSYLHTLNRAHGGPPQLELTVLRPGRKNTYKVVASSGVYHVTPFLGQVLEEPMSLPNTFSTFTALRVAKGDVLGLTVPTWAPVLSYGLNSGKFAYRQSRRANCKNPPATQTARTQVGTSAQYVCNYTGTRVEYSATEITNTPYPKSYVHARRHGTARRHRH